VKPLLVILMGSSADKEHARAIATAAERFGLQVEVRVGSAQRTPEHVLEIVRAYDADPRPKVFVAVAGRANALSAVTDPQVGAPVISCPPPGDPNDVWSSLRMPLGVACATVMEPVNAALFAAKILAPHDPAVAAAVAAEQQTQRERILQADKELLHG
jgi:phosphoribosylaminoimidazole carboxylase PurE protein